MRQTRILLASSILIALVAAVFAAPASAQITQPCLFCSENGTDDDTCDVAANWFEINNAFQDCEVVERCFLGGLICFQFCRVGGSCIATAGPSEGSGASQEQIASTLPNLSEGSGGAEVRRCAAPHEIEIPV